MGRHSVEAGGHTVQAVSGLGDEQAWWGVPKDPNHYPMYQLLVFYGAGSNLTLTISMGKSGADPLAAAKQMATAALSRL